MKKFNKDEKYLYLAEGNQKIARAMEISEIQCNIDESTYKSKIVFESLDGESEVLVNREEYLNKNKLINLQSKGLDVTHNNINYLIEYFRECEDNAKIVNTHSQLGFREYKGREIYRLSKAIGIESAYVGACDVSQKGSRDTYINMLKKEVIGKVELEFALISGMSSILLGYVGEELGLDSTIIHLVGNSTTGKSTALKLAISCFGYPDVKKNGLYGTYNGTNNALIKKLVGLKGVPYALDEISMSNTTNFTKFVYSLANGTDKDRLNKNSELREKESWLTTILSNGEKSLIRASNKNAGVQVRVIEIENLTWTKDAENAESINKVILNNYGHLGIEFAEYLLNQEKSYVCKQYEKVKEALYSKLDEKLMVDTMSVRRCNKFAIILQTALMIQDMLNIKFNLEGMVNMIIKIEQKSLSNRNFQTTAIDYIKHYVDKYRNKFECDTNNNAFDVLGKIKQKNDHIEVQMDKISFKEMIEAGGYEDENVVLRELKKGGFLNCEKDRFTRSRKNSLGCNAEFIVVKIPKEKEKNLTNQ